MPDWQQGATLGTEVNQPCESINDGEAAAVRRPIPDSRVPSTVYIIGLGYTGRRC